MYFFGLATLVLGMGIGLSNTSPVPQNHNLVRHERRSDLYEWSKRSRAAADTTLPVRIALAQSNMDLAHGLLMEISDPESEKYGQHLTAPEIVELFRPSKESVDIVREWLHNAGIDLERHIISPGQGFLKFDASVEELESLLATEYHIFEHGSTKEDHIGCTQYHLPEHIQEHVEFITPAVSFSKLKKKNTRAVSNSRAAGSLPPIVKPAGPVALSEDISLPCYTVVTPDCLQQYYGIPKGKTAHAGNEIGIFESGDYYDQNDLDLTFQFTAPHLNGSHQILHGIDGGVAPQPADSGLESIESVLDMSIIMPLVYPQKSILFQTNDIRGVEGYAGFGDTFLDALDASFCTYDGGDDPTLDPKYPDGTLPLGSWNQSEMCGAYKPTNVISISYGLTENSYSYHYENRQCQEYLKLGLQGVSVIYASGDSGVGNRELLCNLPANWTSYPASDFGDLGGFTPEFPASCPYVTAVGATMFNASLPLTETAAFVPDEDFYSGGGFSDYWPTPDYQASTVQHYLKTTPPPYNLTSYGTPVYNPSGRAYPDIAAIGQNIFMYNEGQPAYVGGTSASAPIVASMITLINEERLAKGKRPVGFLNPTLYKNPQAFNDITTGYNPGCSRNGFYAAKGWDPVTGLGTPNYPKLLDVFMRLP